MLYAPGSKIKLRRTGDTGVVVRTLDGGMVEVRLDELGAVIPVPAEALDYRDGATERGSGFRQARFVPGKENKTPAPPPAPEVDTQYLIIKPWGIQLAFDPVGSGRDHADHYRVFLINDTGREVLFGLEMHLSGRVAWIKNGLLDGTAFVEVGQLRYDELNDSPEIVVEARARMTRGTGPRMERRLKIKPKQFFSRLKTAPLLNRRVHHYVLFEKIKDKKEAAAQPKAAKLKDLTEDALQNRPHKSGNRRVELYSLDALANFPVDIDLHLPSLVGKPKKADLDDALHTQLRHFDRYLADALRVGMDRVFVIHGIGAGILKKAVHERLRAHPHVKSFKNEYHHKYGWGATEVELG
ncbi:MAG: Smr/MutS family protein [Saprospiraceae bacterium]